MSENQVLDAVDTETLVEAIDIEDLLEGVDLGQLAQQEEADAIAGEVGAALGREFGAALGQELGEVIARAIVERPSSGVVVEDAKAALGTALRELLLNPDVRASLTEELRTVLEGTVTGDAVEGDEIDPDTDTDSGEENENGETEGETVDTTDRSEENREPESGDIVEEDEPTPETRAELEELSYRKLQALAKDHDIKANRSREELIDELADDLDLEG